MARSCTGIAPTPESGWWKSTISNRRGGLGAPIAPGEGASQGSVGEIVTANVRECARMKVTFKPSVNSPRSQTLFGNAIVPATLLPPRSETEFRRQVRSQTEFGNEGIGSDSGPPFPLFAPVRNSVNSRQFAVENSALVPQASCCFTIMKKIALTLLVACLCLEAGCSRPTAEAPVVTTSPTPAASLTPRQLTEEQKRRQAAAREAILKRNQANLTPQSAAPRTEAVTQAPSPSPVSSPRP